MKARTVLPLALAGIVVLTTCDVRGQMHFGWQKDPGNPVLSGVAGSWNAHVFSPCVLFNEDSARYEMWFNATSGPSVYPGWRPYSVGFAVSADGIHWTMHPTPVLTADSGAWDNVTIDAPEVIRSGGQYRMWYTSWKDNASPDYLGYATSPDGIRWTKYSGNPVFAPGTEAWEAGGPAGCAIMYGGRGMWMWYAAYDSDFSRMRIGFAWSIDGIQWTRDTVNNPVLEIGAPGSWDAFNVFCPNMLDLGSFQYLWYAGSGVDEIYRTGVAFSTDFGTTWVRDSVSSPVLTPSPGTWDAHRACVGTVMLVGDTMHMWYDGWKKPFASNPYSIGHASALVTGVGEGQTLPRSFVLDQNYPNPFNPSTTIKYELPKASMVRLSVCDMLGREVSVLVNERKNAGVHEVKFYGANSSSGVYIYRLQAGDFVQSKKLMILK